MSATLCPGCNMYDDKEKCPRCGTHVTHGYGLMGGGIGAYVFCCDDSCDYFVKTQDENRRATPSAPPLGGEPPRECTPGLDGTCLGCGRPHYSAVPVEFARRVAEIHAAVASPRPVQSEPSGTGVDPNMAPKTTRECATCGAPLVPYRTCINPDCAPTPTPSYGNDS